MAKKWPTRGFDSIAHFERLGVVPPVTRHSLQSEIRVDKTRGQSELRTDRGAYQRGGLVGVAGYRP